MERRPDWEEISDFSTIFNFKWQPISRGIKFDMLSTNGQRQIVNHFENHPEITTKDKLFMNLREYDENKVFEHVPLTFLIESNSDTFAEDLDRFRTVYNIIEQHNQRGLDMHENKQVVDSINNQISNLHWIKIKNTR